MQSIYLATVFAGAIACLLTSLLLFLRRKSGERSRLILSCIVLFSVFSYIARFATLSQGNEPDMLISVPMLLAAIFMSLSYVLYPIEVISPGYLSFKRIIGVYSPWLALVAVYGLCVLGGVSFPAYPSLLDMFSSSMPVQSWSLLLLCVLFLLPVLFLFFIPYTRRYNNTDKQWIAKYTLCFTVNTMAYLVVLTVDAPLVKILYYYISVGCSLYIAYMELFERLIRQQASIVEVESDEGDVASAKSSQQSPLCERVVHYMTSTSAYRNPDLSMTMLATALYTNRTTLSLAMRELGYPTSTRTSIPCA